MGQRLQSRKGVEWERRVRKTGIDGFAVAGRQAMHRAFDLDERVAGSALESEKAFARRLTQEAKSSKGRDALRDSRFGVNPFSGKRVQIDVQPEIVADDVPPVGFREGLPEERAVRPAFR